MIEALYNFIMGKTELFSIILFGTFIAVYLVLFVIFIWRGNRGVKIALCIISALGLLISITYSLVWIDVIVLPFTGRFLRLKDNWTVPILAFVLALLCITVFIIMVSLGFHRKKKATSEQIEISEPKEYSVPNNVRKENQRMHGEYTIVHKGE